MDVSFASIDLQELDARKVDAYALPFFSDERPLQGALGLLDWRLCGFISKLILRGEINGNRLETTLIPGGSRLRADKLFLFGCGKQPEFDEQCYTTVIHAMKRTLERTDARSVVCALPGRALGLLKADRAMELFLKQLGEHRDEVIVLDDAEAQRAMRAVLEREKRIARAQIELD